MTRDEALAKLRPMEAELRARGIEALYLFGSVARDEARSDSDLDLAYDATRPGFSALHVAKAQREIEESLSVSVDLVSRRAMTARVDRISRDLCRVF